MARVREHRSTRTASETGTAAVSANQNQLQEATLDERSRMRGLAIARFSRTVASGRDGLLKNKVG